MKKLIAILMMVVLLSVGVALVACNRTQPDKDITGVTLQSDTVYYDGQKHSLTVSGTLPQGAQVTYTYHQQGSDVEATNIDGVIEVGVYAVTAEIICVGYKSLTLNATLTILKPSFDTNLRLESKPPIKYDSTKPNQKYKLDIVGNVPAGTQVTYTYVDRYNDDALPITDPDGVSAIGKYTVVATLSKVGYDTVTLVGTLEIYERTFPQENQFSLPNKTFTYEEGNQYSLTLNINNKPIESYTEIQCMGIVGINITYNGVQDPIWAPGVYQVKMTISARGYRSVTVEGTLTLTEPSTNS